MNRWIALNDDTFKPLLDCYKYANRHPELSMEEHRERALNAFIRPLNAQIAIKGAFLFGKQASLADVALFPFVRQLASVDKAWFDALPLPAVQAWLAWWLTSDLFTQIYTKAQHCGIAPSTAPSSTLQPALDLPSEFPIAQLR